MSSNQICKKFGWPLLSFKTADILYEVALESPILPLHSPPAFFAPLVVCQALYHKLVSSRGGPYIPISRPEFRDRHVSSYERFRSVMTDFTLYTTSKHDIQKKNISMELPLSMGMPGWSYESFKIPVIIPITPVLQWTPSSTAQHNTHQQISQRH